MSSDEEVEAPPPKKAKQFQDEPAKVPKSADMMDGALHWVRVMREALPEIERLTGDKFRLQTACSGTGIISTALKDL